MYNVMKGDDITVWKDGGVMYDDQGWGVGLPDKPVYNDDGNSYFATVEDAMKKAEKLAGVEGAWWKNVGSNQGEEPIPGGWGIILYLMYPEGHQRTGMVGYSINWYRKESGDVKA